jgi:hypothetical protein
MRADSRLALCGVVVFLSRTAELSGGRSGAKCKRQNQCLEGHKACFPHKGTTLLTTS